MSTNIQAVYMLHVKTRKSSNVLAAFMRIAVMVQVLWVLLYYMDAVLLEVTCIKFLVDSLGALGPMEYRYLSPL